MADMDRLKYRQQLGVFLRRRFGDDDRPTTSKEILPQIEEVISSVVRGIRFESGPARQCFAQQLRSACMIHLLLPLVYRFIEI